MSLRQETLTPIVNTGYRLTGPRLAILAVLKEAGNQSLTAQELFTRVLARNFPINFSTVYRNVGRLVDLGLVCVLDRGEGQTGYMLKLVEGHHHHLVCKGCGRAWHIDFCPVVKLDDKVIGAAGFMVAEHKLEIYGFCRQCLNEGRQ